MKMSEEETVSDSNVSSYINITLEEEGMKYDTDMTVPEVIFWLEALKSEVLRDIFKGSA